MSGPRWVAVHVLVYVGLLAVASVIDLSPSAGSTWGGALVAYAAAMPFILPFSVLPVALMLGVLWLMRHLRAWLFRVSAVLLCCLPVVLIAAEPRMLLFYLPAQALLGLLLVQPVRVADHEVGAHAF
ncbi:hypothetical protein Q0Z83_057160 [Actinoplanes sichuanensis]|uniref:hypothetical protein n=1 Tax=Actinoplanes sichuanensis TaxID=512349 RepID=UPI00295405F9|nr:hypothetical protein [Actinoplanes sichuanensis]BEL07525.1 hypothetical protein Q0Z83_057160 [Actinoplanes sichuanensis]